MEFLSLLTKDIFCYQRKKSFVSIKRSCIFAKLK